MKNVTLPPLRVDSELRAAAEAVLRERETLSGFVLEAVRLHIIARREAQSEFIARGLLGREQAQASGEYVGADEMLARLDASLATVRSKQAANTR